MSSERDMLQDEIVLRRASISDARREFELGELDAHEYGAVQERELIAIARCEQQLAALGALSGALSTHAAPTPGLTPRKHRRALLAFALLCFGAASVVLVVNAISPRQPGGSDTGGISSSRAQHIAALLSEAELDQAAGNTTYALSAFNQVLALQKLNVEALTQTGWIYFSAGTGARNLAVIQLGEQRVARAVATYPRDPDPLLYYAIIAASTPGKNSLAVTEFRKFLTLHPSASELATAQPWLVRLGVRQR